MDHTAGFPTQASLEQQIAHLRVQLDTANQKFRNLFTSNPEPMLIYDVATLQFIDANDAAIKLYGYTREEFRKIDILAIRPPEDIPRVLKMVKLPGNRGSGEIWRHIKKDGELMYVTVTSHEIMYEGRKARHVMVTDVTGKLAAERKVKVLSESIEQSPVGVLITGPDGVVEFCNYRFTELTGYSPEEVRGKVSVHLKDKSPSNKVWKSLKARQTWRAEFEDVRKDGGKYWAKTTIAPMCDANGNIIHYIMLYEDISDQKKLVAELMQARLKAEESDRLKTCFLANMSHEIRTPMNGILGFVQLLQDPDLTAGEREEFSRMMELSSQRLLSTISDIIDISKIESGAVTINKTRFNLHSLLLDTVNFFAPEAGNRNLSLSIGEMPPYNLREIETDRFKLESILINLVKNALKFTCQGTVTIHARIEENLLQIAVADTGCGVAADMLQCIFERFVQADVSNNRHHEGSGLGLAISKAYAEMLGGTLTVISEEGRGSVFTVTVPC